MDSTTNTANTNKTWDYYIKDGIVPILEGTPENDQKAAISGYLQRGSIPQLPESGIQWTEYFLGEIGFNDIDNQIKNALNSEGLTLYFPTYDLVNDQLITKIGAQ